MVLPIVAASAIGLRGQQPLAAPKPRIAVIPVLDLERQHPRKAMMLTQLDRLVAKELKDKGYSLVSPDDVESAISQDHIDFTHLEDRAEANLLRIGDDTHADLVVLVVVRAVGANFDTEEDSQGANYGHLRLMAWAATRITLSDQKSRHALFTDKEVEGHCVWKLRLANSEWPRIAAAVAVGVEDEIPRP